MEEDLKSKFLRNSRTLKPRALIKYVYTYSYAELTQLSFLVKKREEPNLAKLIQWGLKENGPDFLHWYQWGLEEPVWVEDVESEEFKKLFANKTLEQEKMDFVEVNGGEKNIHDMNGLMFKKIKK